MELSSLYSLSGSYNTIGSLLLSPCARLRAFRTALTEDTGQRFLGFGLDLFRQANNVALQYAQCARCSTHSGSCKGFGTSSV